PLRGTTAKQARPGEADNPANSWFVEENRPDFLRSLPMRNARRLRFGVVGLVLALAALAMPLPEADSACCYFSAKDADISQPAQKAFLTYDPVEKVETFTVQPKFAGNALDFGMVIPSSSKPKLDPAPRDFFNHLAVYTLLKKRVQPQSKLLPVGR